MAGDRKPDLSSSGNLLLTEKIFRLLDFKLKSSGPKERSNRQRLGHNARMPANLRTLNSGDIPGNISAIVYLLAFGMFRR